MKTLHTGNAHRPSKFVKWRREAKRMRKKFGERSQQYRHFLSARPGWADKV
jgi:hypothetical protein